MKSIERDLVALSTSNTLQIMSTLICGMPRMTQVALLYSHSAKLRQLGWDRRPPLPRGSAHLHIV
eukprot:c4479_g1_i1 orf=87-281(+)